MARYSIANRTSNVTSAAATLELIPGAGGTTVVEIGITINAATASVFGIGIAAAQGITPTTPVTLLRHDNGRPNTTTQTALAWGTGPTVPANFFRRVNFPATAGASIVLSFPEGIVIPAGSSLVVWNLTATSVADVNITVSE